MPALIHTHSFVRYSHGLIGFLGEKKRGRNMPKDYLYRGHYKCTDPDCTYHADRTLLIGKHTLCPNCKLNTFVLTAKDLSKARPVCLDCGTGRVAKAHQAAKRVASMMFAGEDELG